MIGRVKTDYSPAISAPQLTNIPSLSTPGLKKLQPPSPQKWEKKSYCERNSGRAAPRNFINLNPKPPDTSRPKDTAGRLSIRERQTVEISIPFHDAPAAANHLHQIRIPEMDARLGGRDAVEEPGRPTTAAGLLLRSGGPRSFQR